MAGFGNLIKAILGGGGQQYSEHTMGEQSHVAPPTTAQKEGYDASDMRRTLPHSGKHLSAEDQVVEGWNPDAFVHGDASGPTCSDGRGSTQRFNGMDPAPNGGFMRRR